MFKDAELNFSKINTQRMLRTVRGSIKKAIFYLGAKIPYDYTEDLAGLSSAEVQNYLKNKGQKIKKYIELDVKIRLCDDIIDNQLSVIKPRPEKRIIEVIKTFIKEVPTAKIVGELFLAENDIIGNDYPEDLLKTKIKNLIDIRPCDFFLLTKNIVNDFGTTLTKIDYKYALEFFLEFQRLRDLLDDIMSTEEDLLKKDYNSIVLAHDKNISYHFFEEIVLEKMANLKLLSQKIKSHPHKNIFEDTINFWDNQYNILFKKLLIDYYINIDEFKKSYFMIKQL